MSTSNHIAIVTILLVGSLPGRAQVVEGVQGSPFAGVNNIYFNPATLAGGRVTLDINLAGAALYARNDYLAINRPFLFNSVLFGDAPYDTVNFVSSYIRENPRDADRSLHLGARALLPSFVVSMANGHAFGLYARVNTATQMNGVPSGLAKLAFEGFNYPALWNLTLSSANLSALSAAWAEYGFTYAATIPTTSEHVIKAGGSLKLLQGLGAAYVHFSDLSFSLRNTDTVSFLTSGVSYGHSDNVDFADEFQLKLRTPFSVGADLGMVYEYRPQSDDRDYVLQVGLALLDAGSITFDKGTYSGDFYADIDFRDVQELTLTSLESLDDSISSLYTMLDSDAEFVVQLPTHINIHVDYNIGYGFYVQAVASMSSFHLRHNVERLDYLGYVALTPRYENKWVGVYLPLSFDYARKAHMGFGTRLGPLTVGTGDVLAWLTKEWIYGLDAYAYVKVTIPMSSRNSSRSMRCPADR